MNAENLANTKKRDSGIELFRIITMLIIVAHHYVVNSGLSDILIESSEFSAKNIFYWLFGWGGKTGINCFVLITGYFMCKSNITIKKFLKLILEIIFYKILFFIIFTVSGYQDFSIKEAIKVALPIFGIGTGFTSSYIVFFLFIPFINILINGMDEKKHFSSICLCLLIYTILPTMGISTGFNYVIWFAVLYFIASFVRIYPRKCFDSKKIWGLASLVSLLISWCSVIAGVWLLSTFGKSYIYHFVADSNKILALTAAFCTFMFFKNINIGYSKVINNIAASAFGVLLIHANSDTMRQWLWRDILDNVGYYNSTLYFVHAICSVLAIYIICTLIDMLRIKFLEKPLFKYLGRYNIK